MKIIIISAVARNGVIGRSNGEMPWHVKEEFQHFKDTTFGYPVIMGRITYETLGKPLKGRLNVIITHQLDYSVPYKEVKIFQDLTQAVESLGKLNPDKIFIIGGAEVYRQAMSFADEMIISIMQFDADGDVHFPKIDHKTWKEMDLKKRNQFDIITYVRNK